MSILGFFLFLILILLLFGLSIISSVLRFIFGIGKKQPKNGNQRYNPYGQQQNGTNNTNQQSSKNRKKIFEEDEGEYVEFEEIKEEE